MRKYFILAVMLTLLPVCGCGGTGSGDDPRLSGGIGSVGTPHLFRVDGSGDDADPGGAGMYPFPRGDSPAFPGRSGTDFSRSGGVPIRPGRGEDAPGTPRLLGGRRGGSAPLLIDAQGNILDSPPYVPGEIVLRFADGSDVGAVADELFLRGQEFASISGTGELDQMLARIGLKKVTRLFPGIPRPSLPPGPISGRAARGVRESFQDWLASRQDSIKAKFRRRSQRAPGRPAPNIHNIFVLEINESVNIHSACTELSRHPHVLWAEPNRIVSARMVPNDPYYSSSNSWGQGAGIADLWGLKQIDPESTWDDYTGSGIVIAVSDSGIYYTHGDITANMWQNPGEVPGNSIDDDGNGYVDDVYGYDFYNGDSDPIDDNGHGTHVAGTIAATGNNSEGIVGVAFDATVMAVKGLSGTGSGPYTALANTIVYAADNGADVINASWGGPGVSQTIAAAVDYALSLGSVFVCAAGNEKVDARYTNPANIDGAIVVGAMTYDKTRSSYSNFGGKVDIFAPGGQDDVSILSLLAPGSYFASEYPERIVDTEYFRANGTSMASPHVAGLVALILEKDPSLTVEQIRHLIRSTADDSVAYAGWDYPTAFGLIDVFDAVTSAVAPLPSIRSAITAPAFWMESPDNYLNQGIIEIHGTAAGTDIDRYEIASAPFTDSASPSFATLGEYPGEATGTLASVDTSGWNAGRYLIRLRTYNTSNDFSDSITLVDIDPAGRVGWPRLGATFWLSMPPSERPENNTQSLVFADLDHDGYQEIITLFYEYLFVWKHDGSEFHPAFPMEITGTGVYWPYASAAVGDLDGDRDLEIVLQAAVDVGAGGQPIYAFHHDGTLVSGFPAGCPTDVPDYVSAMRSIYPPAVVDIDGDGTEEIIFVTGTYNTSYAKFYLAVLNGNGTFRTGWPVDISTRSSYYPYKPATAVAVDDVDGDGEKEIIVGDLLRSLKPVLYAYSPDGAQKESREFSNGEKYISAPIIADLNSDGQKEVFAVVIYNPNPTTLYSRAYLLNHQLDTLSGWPRSTSLHYAGDHSLITDIDGDGELEVAGVGGDYAEEIFAFNYDGSAVAGYPITIADPWGGYALNESPLAAAYLDAGSPVLLAGDYETGLYGFDPAGGAISGWPKPLWGSSGSPAVADLDMDGFIDIGFHSHDGFVYIWEEPSVAGFAQLSEWPTLSGDFRRTGTPFIPEIRFESYPLLVAIGGKAYIDLSWEDLPSDVHYRVVVELVNLNEGGAVSGTGVIEHFGDAGSGTAAINVSPSAPAGTNYLFTARCEYRLDGSAVVVEAEAPGSVELVLGPVLSGIERGGSSGEILFAWDSEPGETYDIFFTDTFGGGWTDVSDVYASGTTAWWVDDGLETGSHPSTVGERYYMVMEQGTSLNSPVTVGQYCVSVQPGMQLVSLPLVPFDPDINAVIGDQLTGGFGEITSDRIWVWDPETDAYRFFWYQDSGGFFPGDGWKEGGDPASAVLNADVGFWMQSRQSSAQTVCFVGKVSGEQERTIPIVEGMQLVGHSYPVPVQIDDTELVCDGFTGGFGELTSDRLWEWDPETGAYRFFWYQDSGGFFPGDGWKEGGSGVEIYLEPGNAYWLQIRNTPFTWTFPRPYENPPN